MNILLIDSGGNFLDFALRCMNAGHDVRLFVGPTKDGSRSKIGDGLVKRVSDFEPSMKWADLICLSDNNKYLRILEGYRKRGYPIFGPNVEVASWELDRKKGQEVLEKNGISVIPSIPFKNYDKAIAHVKQHMKRFVSKPNGDVDKALSYVSKSPADMVFMLEYWKKEGKMKDEFILQEFHGGIEMAVGGWMGKNGFSEFFLENFEHKKLMNDDLGVNTGEQGTVLKYVQNSKLADMVLKPLEAELIRQGYTGYIDVAVIVDKKGKVWPLEFTSRPGWPLFQIQQAVHRGDPAQFMLDLINGEDTFHPYSDIATGVVVTIPDFPYSRYTGRNSDGYPIYGITDSMLDNIHPAEVRAGLVPIELNGTIHYDRQWVTAGDYVLICTGTGDTVEESKEAVYKTVKKIEIPNSPAYRTDIGCRLEEQLPSLQDLGFAEEWCYE